MVRLKAWILPFADDQVLYFNSTMVRLKDQYQHHWRNQRRKFQFHYGTIKRTAARLRGGCVAVFQFHYGTIKR